ncbi:hypothetical protein R1sor_007334 [Riccia sorocarpa]|uniref:Uncharacterized protein n=1 Tax=Riccia sorocarpa TaxID=122646 RepID=A0ABD3HQH8_9MARC
MENIWEQPNLGEGVLDSQIDAVASQGGRASTSGAGVAAAGTSSTTTDLVSVLGGPENYATLMALIAETSSKVALTTGNTLLATLRDMTSHQSILPISTPSGVQTVDGSRAGTPISGASADLPTSGAPPPPKRLYPVRARAH